MILRQDIKTSTKQDGVYLSAKTERGNYGQFYNTVHPDRANYMPNIETAKQRFINFYNQFE